MKQNYYDILKQQQLKAIFRSVTYWNLLNNISDSITKQAIKAPNEATIENRFDTELSILFTSVFSSLGYDYKPIKEDAVDTKVHISKGRADTSIGSLIVEYKHFKKLESDANRELAINQAKTYIEGFCDSGIDKQVAFVTDGLNGCFINKIENEFIVESFQKVSANTVDRLVKIVIGLSQKSLTGQNLVKDFCEGKGIEKSVSQKLVKCLYKILSKNMTGKTQMLLEEWQELFKLAHDDQSQQQAIIERKLSLENYLEVKFDSVQNEYLALFSMQTAYAILVKIVAFKVVSNVKYSMDFIDFDDMSKSEGEELRGVLCDIEDGSIFRKYGINNLLEGDFFSWYTNAQQWNDDLADVIKDVFSILVKYSNNVLMQNKIKAQDFFKELYVAMMPQPVRHSLGEYYTKKWLAKQVVEESINHCEITKWRGIDPCCGSGTFLTVMIEKIIEEADDNYDNLELLNEILSRVYGIDINPVTVLTARVNYFLNIANLLPEDIEIEIPVYLGDASYVPKIVRIGDVECLEYSISTKIKPLSIILPKSITDDLYKFSRVMTFLESDIKNKNTSMVKDRLISIVNPKDLTEPVINNITNLAEDLVYLETKEWDGIWARIITNYLSTSNIGKFDIVVGNPPWVDWKNLPSGYRERIKSLCIARHLFSGDGITGGINLNICALISNVVAENWLSENGILAFLMPDTLLFQQSYEGYRNFYLNDNKRLYFFKITDWTKAGNPFRPVTQKFLTYFISSKEQNYSDSIPVDKFIIKKGKQSWKNEEIDLKEYFDVLPSFIAQFNDNNTMFTYVDEPNEIHNYAKIAGESYYIGREGVEVYPQELLIFEVNDKMHATKDKVTVVNIQNTKSKFKIARTHQFLEKKYLYPLIKGIHVNRFHIEQSNLVIPFPYEKTFSTRIPLSVEELSIKSPELIKFYQAYKEKFLAQNSYSDRLINNNQAEFYALARVGDYCFAENYVVYRDNSKWCASVVTTINTPWGEKKRPIFQNHAPIICQDSDGRYISNDEAHYICAILNTPIATKYIIKSSDSRSYPIRPRIKIPKFDCKNLLHQNMVNLSKQAHNEYNNKERMVEIDRELDLTYMKICEL